MLFFSRKPFGLQITDTHMRVMQLKGTLPQVKILSMAECELPKGMVENGEIKQFKGLAENLQKILQGAQPKPITSNECILTLPESQIYEHIFYLPGNLNEEALKAAVQEKVIETIPVPYSEFKYAYTHYPLEDLQVVRVVGINRVIIAQYYELLKQYGGLHPLVFESEALSLMRSLPLPFESNQGTLLLSIRGKSVEWFSLWKGWIFDSNSLHPQQADGLVDLMKDLKKSMLFFKEKTRQPVGSILLLGAPESLEEMKAKLSTEFNLPIQFITNYKIPLESQAHNWLIVSGAALRGIEDKSESSINLI